MESRAEWARGVAEQVLADELPDRWAHSQGVARQARSLSVKLGQDADLVEAAAWLHDIGYSSALAVTGFHPLDGARYLRDVESADHVLCELVAHHSGAVIEAQERGLEQELTTEFGPADRHPWLLEALTACDLTTTPTGEVTSVEERVAEILQRYGPDDVVYKSIMRSKDSLVVKVQQVFAGVE